MAAISDDEYEFPLLDQRYFGAGIKRKRIQFVPSTATTEATHSTSLLATPKVSAADKYLAIVLKQTTQGERAVSAPPAGIVKDTDGMVKPEGGPPKHLEKDEYKDSAERQNAAAGVYQICHRSITPTKSATRHESSIAHQICLAHSHPPSHLDRRRKGLNILRDQGWDPDSRLGLGATGEGMLHPIKAKENPERVGLGAKLAEMKVKEKRVKLDAGKVKLLEKQGKKKAERLRNAFYRSEEIERYLGEEQVNPSLDLGRVQVEQETIAKN